MAISDAGEFRALLEGRRREVLASLSVSDDSVSALRADRSDATADDEHDPEGSTLSLEWARAEGLRAAQRQELRDVDEAMVRLTAGTYGVCAGCGGDIPIERLRVRPTARTCVACAA